MLCYVAPNFSLPYERAVTAHHSNLYFPVKRKRSPRCELHHKNSVVFLQSYSRDGTFYSRHLCYLLETYPFL